MKDKIINFRLPEEQRKQGKAQGNWIKIEKGGAANLINTVMVVWLGA